MNKIVFTDIDGTLIKGFITIDFVKYLWSKELFDSESYALQENLMQLFKQNKIDFFDWLSKWAKIWGTAMNGKPQKEIISAANAFFPLFKTNIYGSSKELINVFHENGFFVIGISSGIIETATLVKQYLGLDEVWASKLEVKNGVYSSKVVTQLHTTDGKEKAIIDFCKTNAINLSDSVGVGDNLQDLQIFNLTKRNIALNPSPDLREYALKNNFIIATNEDVLDKIKSLF
ncbi:MAG: haloacid dehalogenase-like hydrolase [Candidatus Diapherotrites archaeon]|nr:haloacid dehalogenase-like hydrolase [Candidatus Diapherotrites archaeon]